jgi:hypothetical protein
MAIFSWIVLGFTALMLLGSGLCWLLALMDDKRWKKASVRLFRLALVGVLFYVNGVVWGHIVGSLVG